MLNEDIEAGRRVAFVIAQAEASLGLAVPKGLPLAAHLEALLQAAMERPAAVKPGTYALAYHLLHGFQR